MCRVSERSVYDKNFLLKVKEALGVHVHVQLYTAQRNPHTLLELQPVQAATTTND